MNLIMRTSLQWNGYWYNRSWHHLDDWANSKLAKLTIGIPLLGYIVIFSDSITKHIQFENLASAPDPFLFTSEMKLQLVYFGLVFFAISNVWYLARRPYSVKLAQTPHDYVRIGIERFTVFDFVNVFGEVDDPDTGSVTNYWEFGRSDFEDFIRDLEKQPIPNGAGAPMGDEPLNSRSGAMDRHAEFVRCLLLENYARQTRQRKVEQQLLWFTCFLAFVCLLVPSVDLFQAVVVSIVQ